MPTHHLEAAAVDAMSDCYRALLYYYYNYYYYYYPRRCFLCRRLKRVPNLSTEQTVAEVSRRQRVIRNEHHGFYMGGPVVSFFCVLFLCGSLLSDFPLPKISQVTLTPDDLADEFLINSL